LIARSVNYFGYSCFKNDWVGFDEFKPLTVIIGRNNTGKSQLLDLLKILTEPKLDFSVGKIQCSGVLDEPFLKSVFREGTTGGELGGRHWEDHGKPLLNVLVDWEIGNDTSGNSLAFPEGLWHRSEKIREIRARRILDKLPGVECPVTNKHFRRMLADRDITPEKADNKLSLTSNGSGATNIIRKYITSSSSKHPEELIQVSLIEALDEIFGKDGTFERIEIRQHDETDDEADDGLWEVFLGEPQKGLIPLSRSGSGLKTVILALLNLMVIPEIEGIKPSQMVFALEELENNLHPALLRRLFKYIADFAVENETNVFLTTHSSVALDFFSTLPESQTIHVSHDGKSAKAKTISAHLDKVSLMNELGARPSDLLQANGVIWLEGPSDRIYLNRFIELYSEGGLREGRDYQCAYYGGSVLAQMEFAEPDKSEGDLTNLLRLNANIAVVCDGDRTADSGKGSRIKNRVQRIKREVDKIDRAFIWITEAKEIENYVPGNVWKEVYVHSKAVPDPSKFDKFPTKKVEPDGFVFRRLKRKSFDKCEFATDAVPLLKKADLDERFELKATMEDLVSLIFEWNS